MVVACSLNSVAVAVLLCLIVQRAKLCLDFTCTMAGLAGNDQRWINGPLAISRKKVNSFFAKKTFAKPPAQPLLAHAAVLVLLRQAANVQQFGHPDHLHQHHGRFR